MMTKKSPVTWFLTGLILVTLSCQSLGEIDLSLTQEPTPTPRSWPFSTFVPARKSVQVEANQPIEITSSHLGLAKIESFDIKINGQPLRSEAISEQGGAFPGRLFEMQVGSDQAGQLKAMAAERAAVDSPDLVEVIRVTTSESVTPTSDKSLTLLWIGHVPGRYVLTITATDENGTAGNTITQQIEVR